MRYLVTGCAGFIASRVCRMLIEQGNHVVGIDSINNTYDVRLKYFRLAQLLKIPKSKANNYRLQIEADKKISSRDGKFLFIKGDTSSKADVKKVFNEGPFDAVLNLAARAGVQASMDDPISFIRSNTEGVSNILQAMSESGVTNHVLASTSSVYAPAPGVEPKRSKETDSTDHPKSVYATSKKAAELLCHSYAVREVNPIHTTVVRYFTVYGPAGRPDMSIFRFIESSLRGSGIKVTGSGQQSRDYTYVDDAARGTILASKNNKGFRIINIGGGKTPTTINEAIDNVERTTRRKIKRIKAPDAVADIAISMADVSLAKKELGWQPDTNFRDGIRKTVAWHIKNRRFTSSIDLPGVATIRGKEIIGVIGLGYVGLPLAHSLSAFFKVIGYDSNPARVRDIRRGNDRTKEIDKKDLIISQKKGLEVSNNPEDLRRCTMIIVTVPTPVDDSNLPDLNPVKSAAKTIGKQLKKMPRGTIIVYESTVYPGCTEEDCVPVIEKESGLKCGKHFYIGYSPERINPGDKDHTLNKITKVIAGDSDSTTTRMLEVYARISRDVHIAESIKVAEAAKVIENTQRDLNIALVNELVIIFEKLGIKTSDVLRAAGTKWNFLNFKPGLVGGHCIGVDPYYLTNRAQRAGYHPEIILAGRRLNDSMSKVFADYMVKQCIKWGQKLSGQKVLVLGLTFKEDIPDFRNSKSVNLIRELEGYGVTVDAYDPEINNKAFAEDKEHHGINLIRNEPDDLNEYVAIVVTVNHRKFTESHWIEKIRKSKKAGAKVFDLKNIFKDNRGLADWSP